MTPTHPGVVIRDLESLGDYDACVALQDDIWGHGFSERVPGAILRVAQKIGGVAAGAFDPSGRLVGFVFGMTGLRAGALVHWSDMLAVRPETRGSGLGEALKHFQRDAVRTLGVHHMLWTADPLVARNAHFNINHLGAVPAEYAENMYGDNTGSVLHGAMPTDRFVYRWQLDLPSPQQRDGMPAATDAKIPSAISVDAEGTPIAATTGNAEEVKVHVPHDLSEVQQKSASQALAWRLAVRAAFASRLGHGYHVSRFVRGQGNALPYYVLTSQV
jgi:predicted GNAT superfamily acetyltransferase